jgi:O-antigen ligase
LITLVGVAVLLVVLIGEELASYRGSLDPDRGSLDSAMLDAILSGDWSNIPYSSFGVRLHMLRIGWEWWLERPWFGYGPGAVESMFLHGTVQELQEYTHLHNTLVDNLVRLGGVGTLLLQSLYLYVAYALWRRFRAGGVPLSLGVFALGALLMAFLFGQTDYRMDGWDWRHYWVMIGSISYTLPLACRVSRLEAVGCE